MTHSKQSALRQAIAAVAMILASAFSLLAWYQINLQGKFGAFVSPSVSPGLQISPSSAPSPFVAAFVVIVIALPVEYAIARWGALTGVWALALSLATSVLAWLAITAQQISAVWDGPLSSPGLLFVSTTEEYFAVSLVLAAPLLAVSVAWKPGHRRLTR